MRRHHELVTRYDAKLEIDMSRTTNYQHKDFSRGLNIIPVWNPMSTLNIALVTMILAVAPGRLKASKSSVRARDVQSQLSNHFGLEGADPGQAAPGTKASLQELVVKYTHANERGSG